MTLKGNPFLGKLKVPAPELTKKFDNLNTEVSSKKIPTGGPDKTIIPKKSILSRKVLPISEDLQSLEIASESEEPIGLLTQPDHRVTAFDKKDLLEVLSPLSSALNDLPLLPSHQISTISKKRVCSEGQDQQDITTTSPEEIAASSNEKNFLSTAEILAHRKVETNGSISEKSGLEQDISPAIDADNEKAMPSTVEMTPTEGNQFQLTETENLSVDEKLGRASQVSYIFKRLTGIQKIIILYFYNCYLPKLLVTRPISGLELASVTKTSKLTVKNALIRLVAKKIVSRDSSQKGRSGWTIYKISNAIYAELKDRELTAVSEDQMGVNFRENQARTSSSATLERGISKDIGEESQRVSLSFGNLPSEWQLIDSSSLRLKGFKDNWLIEIYKAGKLSAQMVQDSIYEIEHDLKSGNHGLKSPMAVFYSALCKKGVPYTATSPGYESEETVYEKRRFAELKRRSQERERVIDEQEVLEAEDEDLAFQKSHPMLYSESKRFRRMLLQLKDYMVQNPRDGDQRKSYEKLVVVMEALNAKRTLALEGKLDLEGRTDKSIPVEQIKNLIGSSLRSLPKS